MAKSEFGQSVSKMLLKNRELVAGKKTALDIGCANGANSYFLASLGLKIDAVDIKLPGSLAAHPNIDFIQADIREFEFSKKYDIILAFNSLPFLSTEDREAVLGKIASALAPGGLILATGFTEDDPSRLSDKPFKNYFKTGELALAADALGLKIAEYREFSRKETHGPAGLHEHRIASLIARKKQY